MKRYLAIISLIFLWIDLFAQVKNETQILIKANSSLRRHNYAIIIKVKPRRIHINYEVADSIDRNKFKPISYGDNMLSKSINTIGAEFSIKDSLLRDSIRVYYEKLDSSIRASTIYSRYEIVIRKKQKEYFKLLGDIFNSNEKELTKNANRNTLDGIYFNIVLLKNGIARKYSAHSPSATSQPLLGKLMEETIAFLPKKEQKKYPR